MKTRNLHHCPASRAPAGSLASHGIVGKGLSRPGRRAAAGAILAAMLCVAAVPAADQPPDDPLRLDPRVRPVTQSLELHLDPAADGFVGTTRVELQFEVATNRFRFHAVEIELGKATLDGQALVLKAETAGIIAAAAGERISPGRHLLEVAFTNRYLRAGAGLYKTVAGGRPFLFTHFEPNDARRAFPCWDEPGFKIPWRLTLRLPRDLDAVANMPVAQTTMAGDHKVLEFGRTPPMPSYLVALAVGAFEFVPISGQAVPGRVVTVPGQVALGRLAVQEAPALLAGLEQYFGLPFPYPKLDHIAAPEHLTAAMENVGAIIYQDSAILFGSSAASGSRRRRMIELVAHEMAHMWFGNLVTLQWWNDLWLNEAFATWISYKVAGRLHPGLRFDLEEFNSRLQARYNDTQPTVKSVRRPFRGGDNLTEAFDTLSYRKGQAILAMIEGWVGEDGFRAGLKRYFLRHSWGNTRAEDLWAALAEAGDDRLPETLRRYLEQPGIPELSVQRLPGDRLQVRQRRYRTLTAKGVSEQVWHVPMVVRLGDPSGGRTVRLELRDEEQTFSVPGLDRADWIHPNAGESGHYFWSLSPDLMLALTRGAGGSLSVHEQLGLLSGAEAARMSGRTSGEQVLQFALSLAESPDPAVRSAAAYLLWELREWAIPPEALPAFGRLIRRTLRPMLDHLGLSPCPGESVEVEAFRAQLISMLGELVEDPEIVAFSRETAARQLADPKSVPASLAGVTLQIATRSGDKAWSDRLRTAFEQAREPGIRFRFGARLTAFRDPALVRSGLDYALSDAVKPSELLLCIISGRPDTAAVRLEWLVQNYAAVKKKLPPRNLPGLVRILRDVDADLLARGRAFFLDPARRDATTERILTEVLDERELEEALRKRDGARLAAFIRSRLGEPQR